MGVEGELQDFSINKHQVCKSLIPNLDGKINNKYEGLHDRVCHLQNGDEI